MLVPNFKRLTRSVWHIFLDLCAIIALTGLPLVYVPVLTSSQNVLHPASALVFVLTLVFHGYLRAREHSAPSRIEEEPNKRSLICVSVATSCSVLLGMIAQAMSGCESEVDIYVWASAALLGTPLTYLLTRYSGLLLSEALHRLHK